MGLDLPPALYHYWSKIYYRSGRYALALQDVARGFTGLKPDDLCTRGAGLAGHLVGLLVDVDLPAPAAVVQRQIEDGLAHQMDAESVAWERHKLHDRAARIALRQGQAARANALYRLKRQESALFGSNGQRELSWLLYIESWRAPASASAFAEEAGALLDAAVGDEPWSGNADGLYLLRAYAAWAWRSRHEGAWHRLSRFKDRLEERLFHGDAGPPGFVFAFLHLAHESGIELPMRIPDWNSVTAVLEDQRYFLELAAFQALRGMTEQAAVLLERFARQRATPTPLLFPDWLGDGVLADWDALIAARASEERRILMQEPAVTPEALLASGLLPL